MTELKDESSEYAVPGNGKENDESEATNPSVLYVNMQR